jgi:hypothetical protein
VPPSVVLATERWLRFDLEIGGNGGVAQVEATERGGRLEHESGVQVEPVGARVTGPQRGRRDVFRWVAAPADALTARGPMAHAPSAFGAIRKTDALSNRGW